MVIDQAERAKVFRREDRYKPHFSFSHLYTGLDYEGIAAFISLRDESVESDQPVPKSKMKELGELCRWLYGDKALDIVPQVESQNPHLRQLDEVLRSNEATDSLRAGLPLTVALEVSYGDEKVFHSALIQAKEALQKARGTLSTGFNGEEELMRLGNAIAELASDLADEMERKSAVPRRRRRSKQDFEFMSDLTTVPKPHVANISSIADFTEIECLRRRDGSVSCLDISRILQRESESYGDDAVKQIVEDTFGELADRARHCGTNGGYPYELRGNGALLARRQPENGGQRDFLYWYLLLSTRMNMRDDRKQGGLDATVLFEHLCREVAVRFMGGPSPYVDAVVFGTGRCTDEMNDHDEVDQGVFKAAVDRLCTVLGEGVGFNTRIDARVHAKDGKLDIVVWRRFADKRPGQLIGFGQCKTGKHWNNDLMKLQPEGFCAKWMQKRPAVLPVRLYFVADRVFDNWHDRCVDGGILFDRCRIVDQATDLPADLLQKIEKWVAAAASSEGLMLS